MRPLTRAIASLTLAALGCSRAPTDEGGSSRASSTAAIRSASARVAASSEPRFRSTLDVSAYAASLAMDGDDVYVLTSRGIYRFGRELKAERWSIELGDMPALSQSGIVYWREGQLRRAPKQGGESQILASVPRSPRRLVAAGSYVVWEEAEGNESRLWTLAGSEPKTIYRGPGSIEALNLLDDQAYFVARHQERWRLGVVALGGGTPRYTEERATRTPAALATAGDVFFYDGPTSSLRRVASDLSREEVLARDVICSPLTVADRVYCAQISLLFEIPRDGGAPRPVVPKRSGSITALVASRSRVAWLLDAGDNRAELEVLER